METENAPKANGEILSYCRQCGGNRYHKTLAEVVRNWDEDGAVCGGDTWSTLECCGCRTITFAHGHWFSEEFEYGENGPEPIFHHDIYPPAPNRKMPEWGALAFLALPVTDGWMRKLHEDVYRAIGIKSLALAAMGIRAIIDRIVTFHAKLNDGASFRDKLAKLTEQGLISETKAEVIASAFDAGSAAAHRGHTPREEDVYILLDIAEDLMERFYISPAREHEQARKAQEMSRRTPQRSLKKTDSQST